MRHRFPTTPDGQSKGNENGGWVLAPYWLPRLAGSRPGRQSRVSSFYIFRSYELAGGDFAVLDQRTA
jgi:hypothetical protein